MLAQWRDVTADGCRDRSTNATGAGDGPTPAEVPTGQRSRRSTPRGGRPSIRARSTLGPASGRDGEIASEELSVPHDPVTVIQGDTMLTPDQGITWGSLSIQSGGMQIGKRCATARQALLAEGARTLRMDSDAVAARDGVVSPKTGGKGVSYAALVGGRDFSLVVNPKAPLKRPEGLRHRRQVDCADRHPRQGGRTLHVHARLQTQGDAARARGPAHGDEGHSPGVERFRLSQGAGCNGRNGHDGCRGRRGAHRERNRTAGRVTGCDRTSTAGTQGSLTLHDYKAALDDKGGLFGCRRKLPSRPTEVFRGHPAGRVRRHLAEPTVPKALPKFRCALSAPGGGRRARGA